MPRRDFVADFQAACVPGAAGPLLNDVKAGEDDGTFSFNYIPSQLEVTIMIPELSDYPSKHDVYIMCNSPDAPDEATDALEAINSRLNRKPVSSMLSITAAALGKALGTADGTDSEVEQEHEEDEEEDDDDFGGWDSDEDELLGHSVANGGGKSAEAKRVLQKALRNDLRVVRLEGYKVGFLGDWKGGVSLFVSVGIRIGKLGISDEVLAAWGLDSSKYLILLIRYNQYYQKSESLTTSNTLPDSVSMLVGTSRHYKPSLKEAIAAFTTIEANKSDANTDGYGLANDAERKTESGFEKIFISGPLNELLNKRFLAILNLRIRRGYSWDGAEMFYNANQARQGVVQPYSDAELTTSTPPKGNLKALVLLDALQGVSPENRLEKPFPLLAMQYTLRHLVRCTEFCLVCHARLDHKFEALKPYVCSNPLCLYQYMSLGFGPSVEHEIETQPSVVDLLVSFCYSAATGKKLKEFPTGLDITVPPISTSEGFQEGTIDWKKMELHPKNVKAEAGKLAVGDWVVILLPSHNEEAHCRVLGLSGGFDHTTFKPTAYSYYNLGPPIRRDRAKLAASISAGNNAPEPSPTAAWPMSLGKQSVTYSSYSKKFDELTEADKNHSISVLLDLLPSVSDMQEWLHRHSKVGSDSTLRGWKERLSSASMSVLRWIIASNRSCIVPVNEDESSTVPSREQRVHGMGDWKQFRFAMGAPDKEDRFVQEVDKTTNRLSLKYPTIFAFHGSPIANWHSIIREGLNFLATAHGRAYGNGCYHSLEHQTSFGYCQNNLYRNRMPGESAVGEYWPGSDLKLSAAMSLNEIVNAPSEFVSRAPHLVVAQLDWIQTRYLFVTTNYKATHGQVLEGRPPNPAFPMDPAFIPRGVMGSSLIVPAGASSRSGKAAVWATSETARNSKPPPSKKPKTRGKSKKNAPKDQDNDVIMIDIDDDIPDDASVCTTDSDLVALCSDDEDAPPPAPQPVVPVKKKPTRKNPFVPGSLDWESIKLLSPPGYATPVSTKRLQTDLRHLIELQQKHDIEELGFYIDPDRIENVYQWIVEFHSFHEKLPLALDMEKYKVTSIIVEVRFGPQYPMSPPFFRVIRPRFLEFARGGGGHVTIGGAICLELLTNNGWSAVNTMEAVLMQVRLAMAEEEPAARLIPVDKHSSQAYGAGEAMEAYLRYCRTHGWTPPPDLQKTLAG